MQTRSGSCIFHFYCEMISLLLVNISVFVRVLVAKNNGVCPLMLSVDPATRSA